MYVNKCIKCGREFETKNPKREIEPIKKTQTEAILEMKGPWFAEELYTRLK